MNLGVNRIGARPDLPKAGRPDQPEAVQGSEQVAGFR
jgi:hypothetical protein